MKELALTLGGVQINPPSGVPAGGLSYLQIVLNNALTIFIIAGIFLVLIFIVWAGISWITSGGDKNKLAAARARATWAIIGLIIILLAFFIINTLSFFFKVSLLNFP